MDTAGPKILPVKVERINAARLREAAEFVDVRMKNLITTYRYLDSLDATSAGLTQGRQLQLLFFSLLRQCDLYKTEISDKLTKVAHDIVENTKHLHEVRLKVQHQGNGIDKKKEFIQNSKTKFETFAVERKKLVSELVIPELASVKVTDQRDKANELFIWALEAIYEEPLSKYYWDNFREQALIKDKGADLRTRLDNFRVGSMTTTSTEATEQLVHNEAEVRDAIHKNKQQPFPPSVDKLFAIAKNISASRKIYLDYAESEKDLKKVTDLSSVTLTLNSCSMILTTQRSRRRSTLTLERHFSSDQRS
eukprot:TRINITY_DN11476_c0_g1_i4.p1 TRINITY_DN11476_c0_g1~~TRINITY_DN11476_c0_g1_i4.p1  ORF type:complete len:307 (+),score=79.62 TRINITY_DN11476_c0_g1_i4:74-994(+)